MSNFTFSQGWNLVSSFNSDVSFKDLFAKVTIDDYIDNVNEGVYEFTNNGTIQSYNTLTDLDSKISVGTAYFVYTPSATTIDVDDLSKNLYQQHQFDVTLNSGWNMLSSPFWKKNIKFSDLNFYNSIDDVLQYNEVDQKFENVDKTLSSMQYGRGYMIYLNKNVNSVIVNTSVSLFEANGNDITYSGGNFDLSLSGTVQMKLNEGAFVNGDKTKLDGIANEANNFSIGEGDITNTMLAAGVETSNSEKDSEKLITSGAVYNVANSLLDKKINFGGVELKLNESDTEPAFNLQNATNYPASALTGTIADDQLASTFITASDLATSSVTGVLKLGYINTGDNHAVNLFNGKGYVKVAGSAQLSGLSTTSTIETRLDALESAPRIIAACKYNGGTDTISYANNITDNSSYPEKKGTGHYKFQLITAHSSANYVIVASIIETGDRDTVVQVVSGQQTDSTFEIIINEDAPGSNEGTPRDRVFMFLCVGE